jgi:hypothetical protein
MNQRLTTIGQVIKQLGNKISVTDNQTMIVAKSGIPIVSSIPSGRGLTFFIDINDKEKLEQFLLKKYTSKYKKLSVLSPYPPSYKDESLDIKTMVSATNKRIFQLEKQLNDLNANLQTYKGFAENIIGAVLENNEIVKEIRDVWKTEDKNEQH